MSFEKTTPATAEFFAKVAPIDADVQLKKVFGYPAAFVNGNMFGGVHENSLIMRLSEDNVQKFLDTFNASILEPMPGRPMKEYVVVPESMWADEPALKAWMAAALAYGRTLPPKAPKPPKDKKAHKASTS